MTFAGLPAAVGEIAASQCIPTDKSALGSTRGVLSSWLVLIPCSRVYSFPRNVQEHFSKSLRVLEEQMKRIPKLAAFVRMQLDRPEFNQLTMESLLILPIQRVRAHPFYSYPSLTGKVCWNSVEDHPHSYAHTHLTAASLRPQKQNLPCRCPGTKCCWMRCERQRKKAPSRARN